MATEGLREVRGEPVGGGVRRRTTVWLLAGWCALSALWIAAASLSVPICPFGQAGCDQSPVLAGPAEVGPAVVVALLGAVALLALWWWDRRRPAPAHPDGPPDAAGPRRVRLRWLIGGSIVGVLIGAHLLMLAPMEDNPFCATPVRINAVMAYPLNCDSQLFMDMAHHPHKVLEAGNMRQARPAYIAAAALATRLLGPPAHALGIDRLYGQTDTAYIPLVLINLLVAAASVAMLAWLLFRIGTPPWPAAALCALVVVNDIAKAFYWTPHQQMFAMLVPVATVLIGRWVLLSRPSWLPVAAVGFVVGAFALAYGSLVITVAVVTLLLLARGWRGLVPAASFLASFAILPVGWIVICDKVAGSYYNNEAHVYHEFVWLLEAYQGGRHTLRVWTETMSILTVREVVTIAGLPLAVLACLAVLAVLRRVRLRPDTAEDRAILITAALTSAVSVVFGWAIGLMASRLLFPVVPGVLIGAGWLIARLSRGSRRTSLLLGGGMSLVVLGVVTVALSVHGPYG
jgi:hypothetical protein